MRKLLLIMCLLLSAALGRAVAQDRTISGRVTDRTTNEGIPGVTVLAKGTQIGGATNADGSFSLSVPASATTLRISSVGYIAVDQPITNGTISVSLAADNKQLGEVVVTALGVQRQAKEIGYAQTTIQAEELNQARVTNVTNGLTGKVAGLQIQTLSAGINPSVRVTLRGTRSITGDNQALIVLDGVIVPNDVLTALNPDDVASVTVLKGANSAALYGSQASNGALVITTKKGGTTPQVTFSQTSQFESLAFLPKFQDQFGNGANVYTNNLDKFDPDGNPDIDYHAQYQGFENQQFGPRYDGSLQPIGVPTESGNIERIAYSARPNERRDFFQNAYQMQNNVSFSGGDEKSKIFVSFQNVHNNGIIPKDKFDRNTFRLNASRELGKLTVGFNASYSQKRVDQTANISRDQSVYWNVFNTAAHIPLTSYKDWRNNEFANYNGYYNAFYYNPYYILDNNRAKNREDYIIGNVDLGYKIFDWLNVQYRIGTTNIAQSSLTTQDKLVISPFASENTYKAPGFAGFTAVLASNLTRVNSDFFINIDKTFGDITVRSILGNNVQQLDSRFNANSSSGLSIPGLFNLQNRVGELNGSNGRFQFRQYSFFGDLTLGYKDFLFVHGSARNDWVSTLPKENRSVFYPGADVSLVFSDLVPALKESSYLDYGKVRAGITKVAQVNLPNNGPGVVNTGGAYALETPFVLGGGFPFGALTSFTRGNQLITPGLKPEVTRSIEAGVELGFLKRRVNLAATYYTQKSTNQSLSSGISRGTGYSGLLLNAGEVKNDGVEVELNLTPVRLDNSLTFTIGGNYNFNRNEVITIAPGVKELALTTGGNANLFAIEGQPFPVIRGSVYERDANGRVILDAAVVSEYGPETIYFPRKAAGTEILGNTLPKHKFGFNSSVGYKGLTLAAQAEYRTGYVVYHTIGEDMDFTGSSQRSVQYGRQDFVFPNSSILGPDGVTRIANTQGLTPGGSEFWSSGAYNTSIAENYVTTGTFFKIREVSLSYAVPTDLLTKTGFIKGVSLNLYGRNIFTRVPKENQYTDPEFSFGNSNSNAVGINNVFQTPPTKFYGASLSATF